jgi:hypothetical protein
MIDARSLSLIKVLLSIDSKQFTEFQPRSAEPDGFGSTLKIIAITIYSAPIEFAGVGTFGPELSQVLVKFRPSRSLS